MPIEKSKSGHKERLRKKFLSNGLEAFHDYEIIEMLLGIIIFRKDTKPIAKKLLKKFGLITTVRYESEKEPHRYDGNLIVNNGSIIISSPQNKVFNAYRDLWYPEGVKIIPLNIGISPLSLAIWAMDDGSNSKSGGFYFHSQGFTLKDNERLIKYLNEQYNLFCKIHYIKGKPIIYVRRESKKLLFFVINKFICKSMQYKFIY